MPFQVILRIWQPLSPFDCLGEEGMLSSSFRVNERCCHVAISPAAAHSCQKHFCSSSNLDCTDNWENPQQHQLMTVFSGSKCVFRQLPTTEGFFSEKVAEPHVSQHHSELRTTSKFLIPCVGQCDGFWWDNDMEMPLHGGCHLRTLHWIARMIARWILLTVLSAVFCFQCQN